MDEWIELGFQKAWTFDSGELREVGFPLQVYNEFPKISDIRCGLFLGWEESVEWWRATSEMLPAGCIAKNRLWIAEHQTSGFGCALFAGQLVPVSIAEPMLLPVVEFCQKFYGSQLHCFGDDNHPTASNYRGFVASLGLTANHPFRGVREGAYPLDATASNLELLISSSDRRAARALEIANQVPVAKNQLRLFILADNSD